MDPRKITLIIAIILFNIFFKVICQEVNNTVNEIGNPDNVFNGVYTECFFHLSYSCLQKKTLLYLKELNNLSEVSVIGDYVKFVKINTTEKYEDDDLSSGNTDELAFMIDKAVDDFFNNHILKFNALGRDISLPRNMEEFVGRKKRKGGGGGGGGHGGHDDGGKKKMMMMAMMCMKMKLMMMVPAMMGMMGMMSFKGMMFSMMSFMLSKMMLLMKILEKKGGASGIAGSGASDGGWMASGAGGGAWMPAGGQDYAGGGYDANGQWQSRSIAEHLEKVKPHKNSHKPGEQTDTDGYGELDSVDSDIHETAIDNPNSYWNAPEISFVKPVVRYNSHIKSDIFKNPVLVYKKSNVDFSNDPNNGIDGKLEEDPTANTRSKRSLDDVDPFNYKIFHETDSEKENTDAKKEETRNDVKSRRKRSLIDMLQNSYIYWINKLLGLNNNRRGNFQRYRIINGVKYVYYPRAQKLKMPKEVQLTTAVKVADEFKPVITAEDFNKGEIMEGAVESRMNKKKFHKMKDTVNDTVDENPWE